MQDETLLMSRSHDRALYPRAALFDLDGTLVDSLPDIAAAVGELLQGEGLQAPSRDEVRTMIGHGLGRLVTRAFASQGRSLGEEAQAAMLDRMVEIYSANLTTRTTLMPGTLECLDRLVDGGCLVALVTNKRQTAAAEILDQLGVGDHFARVVGEQGKPGGLALKPSPDMLLFALAEFGVAPGDAIMVGDSSADVQAAHAARVFSVGLRNGYSVDPIDDFSPDVAIDSLAQFPAAIEAWRARV